MDSTPTILAFPIECGKKTCMDFLYSDLFWACLMVGSIFLLIGSIVAWCVREWGKRDIY